MTASARCCKAHQGAAAVVATTAEENRPKYCAHCETPLDAGSGIEAICLLVQDTPHSSFRNALRADSYRSPTATQQPAGHDDLEGFGRWFRKTKREPLDQRVRGQCNTYKPGVLPRRFWNPLPLQEIGRRSFVHGLRIIATSKSARL